MLMMPADRSFDADLTQRYAINDATYRTREAQPTELHCFDLARDAAHPIRNRPPARLTIFASFANADLETAPGIRHGPPHVLNIC
jgi:hypothetical protein